MRFRFFHVNQGVKVSRTTGRFIAPDVPFTYMYSIKMDNRYSKLNIQKGKKSMNDGQFQNMSCAKNQRRKEKD